jgi:hypothetical protein
MSNSDRYITRTTHDVEGERTSYYDKHTGLITETFVPRPPRPSILDELIERLGIDLDDLITPFGGDA